MMIVLAILLGGFFGFALYKVGAANMDNLISMLSFQNLTLMKIIVFAIGLASVLLSIFYGFGWFDVSHLSVKPLHLGVVIGGLIFGLGFGSVGTCPGTCVAGAMTGGFKKAISAILGGLAGAFLFSISYGWLANQGFFEIMNLGKLTLFHVSEQYPSVFNIGYIGLAMVGVVFILVATFIPVYPFNKKG
ncbi:YeeE/YedE family protein [Turicibacter sanguinis]|uniref:YeeE/YedE thiosulfate transporter family protein n=1 Tax=Turicibacter sanguinis TaxID=154288 RepID=UPI0012BCFB61|nr:YeeE/YedE thiosulfate transporter family protein [Turicibacter sanguinis]MTP72591.1 YeeE/YedE family protein [Turicibacter sanguinis]